MSDLPEYGLTIKDPWAQAIVWGPKRILNKTERPPDKVVGERIAIYVAKSIDKETKAKMIRRVSAEAMVRAGFEGAVRLNAEQRRKYDLYKPIDEREHPGHIIGTVRVVGFVDHDPQSYTVYTVEGFDTDEAEFATPPFIDDWYVDEQTGWLLDNPKPLDEPVSARGMPGIWKVVEQIKEDDENDD